MGEDTSAIKQEIEQTRSKMGDTVEALGDKADLPARAKDRAGSVANRVSAAAPDTTGVKRGARRAVGVAQENPLGLAVAAAGVGFVAGMLIPETSVEKRTINPVAHDVKGQAVKTGQEAIERGKDVAQQAAESAADTAKAAGVEQAGELGESLKSGTRSSSSKSSSSSTTRKRKRGTTAKKPASSTRSRGKARTKS